MSPSDPLSLLIKLSSTLPGMAWILNPGDGQPMLRGPNFREFFGDCACGEEFDRLTSVVHPDDRPLLDGLLNPTQPHPDAYANQALRCRLAETGEYRWFDVHYGTDPHRPDAWVLRMLDIDRTVKAEEALRTAHQRKDEFIAMLGHEMRNPLAPIRNACAVLRELVDSPMAQQEIDLIDDQVVAMVRLVDDLLDSSRLAFSKLSMQSSWVDLRALLRSARRNFVRAHPTQGHRLLMQLPAQALHVQGDRHRLLQALGNLLRNAVSFSPPSSPIVLALNGSSGTSAGVHPETSHAVITVTDRGVGIPPDQLERVFDAFQQSHEGHARVAGSLGLGLTLAQQIVRLHGGRIDANSEGTGLGSRFTITLPLAQPQSPANQQPLLPSTPQARVSDTPIQPRAALTNKGPCRILIVDDNIAAADSLSLLLQAWGHDCRTAYDGRFGLQQALSFDPHVVILDIAMPGLGGVEVARQLRAQPRLQPLQIIALTGFQRGFATSDTPTEDIDAWLTKPADLTTLRELIGRAAPVPAATA